MVLARSAPDSVKLMDANAVLRKSFMQYVLR